ncbi:hypothetical protein RB601_002005 [Gaeumannomyces tritici]
MLFCQLPSDVQLSKMPPINGNRKDLQAVFGLQLNTDGAPTSRYERRGPVGRLPPDFLTPIGTRAQNYLHSDTASTKSILGGSRDGDDNSAPQDAHLSRLGLEVQARRDMGILGAVAAGWNICNSWAAAMATLVISASLGGPTALIYGIMVIFVLAGSSALSMAEIASAYPTAGGQYHWTSILVGPGYIGKPLSYICGALNTFGWIATAAGFLAPLSDMVRALAGFLDPTYVAEGWHTFLIFQVCNVAFTAYNIFLMKRTPWIHQLGFFLSIVSFLTILVTCLAQSDPKQSSEVVWTTWVNRSGWSSDGLVFLMALSNANFIYSGLDGAIHLAEECINPAVAVPAALISTVVIGFVTALAFVVAMIYSYNDLDKVLAAPLPVLEIWYQATRSKPIATAFLILLIVGGFFAGTGSQQTASRLTWSFARDDAVVGSRFLRRMNFRFGVPVNALLVNCAFVFLLGCVNLASSAAFTALVATGLILLQCSFAIPAALVLRRRLLGTLPAVLPESRPFRLPGVVGGLANFLSIALAFISLVFYSFPVSLPVTPGNMNYASVVIAVMAALAAGNWVFHASRNYHGPKLPQW